MVSINTDKLLGKIHEKRYNLGTFSAALGISRPTLNTYINDVSKIPYGVIQNMVTVLECSFAEAVDIFFTS